MKLQTKLILSFIAGLVMVISLAQTFQYFRMVRLSGKMASKNTQLMREIVEKNAINVFNSVERALSASLQRGEMEKFDRMVREQSQVPGLVEFSLYDRGGKLYSSTLYQNEKVELPAKHPQQVAGKTVTTNCIRCHDANEIKLPFRNVDEDLLAFLQGRKEMLVRQSAEVIEIFQPQMVTASCIRCHREWSEGSVSGYTHFKFSKAALLDLEQKVQESLSEIRSATLIFSIQLLFAILVILTPLAYIYTRQNLVLRLQRLGEQIRAIAGGDLSRRIPVPAHLDEISVIATYVNTMADNLAGTASTVGRQSETVAGVVKSFGETRRTLDENARNTHELAQTALSENKLLVSELRSMQEEVDRATGNIDAITSSVNALSGNVNTVAAAAEQASQNVNTMAAAAEEMTANVAEVNASLNSVNTSVGHVAESIRQVTTSLDDVRGRCQEASKKSAEADGHAQAAESVMRKLSDAAVEIGKVVELINNIAEQTNMLALNASIEAAGAGSSGRGFAVVANEVKDLARQTTEATNLIEERIADMQNSARDASRTAQQIAQIIRDINEVNNDIATSVDQQSTSAQQVADATQRVADASTSVTHNAQELKSAVQEVARAAAEAAAGTAKIARSSAEMASHAEEVATQSAGARNLMQSATASTVKTRRFSDNVQEKMGEACRIAALMNETVGTLGALGQTMQESSEQLTAARNDLDRVTSHHKE